MAGPGGLDSLPASGIRAGSTVISYSMAQVCSSSLDLEGQAVVAEIALAADL